MYLHKKYDLYNVANSKQNQLYCGNCTTEILLITFNFLVMRCLRRILCVRVLVLALNDRLKSAAEQFSLL
jgi:hypothetical protein